MSADEANEPPAAREFAALIAESRAWLAERGEIVVRSGSFHEGGLDVAIHCDFGPPEQDKTTNQDFALAWRPRQAADRGQNRRSPRLVLALSDGLTNSYRSECAAELACWLAMCALVETAAGTSSHEAAKLSFNAAAKTIANLADELARDPEASCPEGQFLSTWKYILKKGGIFQTTLTMAWLDDCHFYLASIGDGGAVLREYGGRATNDRVLAACDLNSQQVRALGPAESRIEELDCWIEEEIRGPFLCALFTDGVGRGIGADSLNLLDQLDTSQFMAPENPARHFIEKAIREQPKKFDDNLTLAIIRRERTSGFPA